MGNKSELPEMCSTQVGLVLSLPLCSGGLYAFPRARISVINTFTLIVFLLVVS